ncbi:glucose 6-phosphate dehydrogenase assembly protein [Synechococcus sp. BIOS-E4-1]|uniref:glucose-6-phosphate dehydrogenase assembly protein OpcA n=1 Tax=unclassified Synechococcus TaxID=2626047 RepID=UPI0007BBE295|nr:MULTISPECIES: glucose-6-phosphate dehydrogenase assembly protein OpcA [unclassified Synechococcus]KZR85190.1 Glucose-6-phosphate dehydrogenase subunit [Synechococcus sp. MIT S9504]KZR91277.1 Glucose-6-phosphate dehydrogenase subunit [Synechococcus sp. MIT S9509]QNI55420.1 glucose 6-phosphate dehydrogenase assembly protein [Synechococcus sp. BIOS-E4-1]
MSPQLTLQTPLELPPSEVPGYLEQLWSRDQPNNVGAHTFCLLVWQPAWVEQQLVRTGRLDGPITGVQRSQLIAAGRQAVVDGDLPISTPPLTGAVATCLSQMDGGHTSEDLRGQHVDAALSNLRPRRLITLAPSLDSEQPLETLVAAYCPLPEEGGGTVACGDVVVLRGGKPALQQGLTILDPLLPEELPSWVWWNGALDEAPELLQQLASSPRRLILDSALGEPGFCLNLLASRIEAGQAVNDLNWLRLGSWHQTLAMVFDPPHRRDALGHVVQLDIDVEGDHPVQGLLLASWIADRLSWELQHTQRNSDQSISANFRRPDGTDVQMRVSPVPMGQPSIHPGQIVGLRLICKPDNQPAICVILCAESGGCMRLEAGGMASMELIEEVVPVQHSPVEADVSRQLEGGHDSTNPLLASAAPLAAKLIS